MQVKLLNGIYVAPGAADFRTTYPRNLIPVPKPTGVAEGYLRPADGIRTVGSGPGVDRGAINWAGSLYRVMGSTLCRVTADGDVVALGDVGGLGRVSLDYSFDRLAIASGGSLFYWDGAALTQVTDPDLGSVVDMRWIAGYFLTTDGTNLITTDLNDPASVQVLNYGSSEADPDPVVAVDEMRNEAYAFNRYTIEVFQNVGGTGFPFQRIDGAQVGKGPIGTHAYCSLGNTFAFMGSGRGEAPAVYIVVPGDVQKISTREIDEILEQYTEEQLAASFMECKVGKNHQHILIHLPDQCLVYDTIGSAVIDEPLWFTLTTSLVGNAQYRATGLVWCYDQWNVGDPQSGAVGVLVSDVATHYEQTNGWDFGTMVLYNAGNSGIVHELELVCLTGKVAADVDPVVWTSYTHDGENWSQERATKAGKQGERMKRICWRMQGTLKHWRIQRFRGTSDAHVAMARLEAQIEPLFAKAMNYG